LPPSALGSISPGLATIPSLDVGVVNLHYDDDALLRYNGFGYLVPKLLAHRRGVDGAATRSRSDVLGVLFDSTVAPGLDGAGGTKLTVLLGGAVWAAAAGGRGGGSAPSERELVRAAREAVREQLWIGAEPDVVNVRLLRECIPQLPVGHAQLVCGAMELLDEQFAGKVGVTGTAVHWPSVPMCFAGAWRQACWVSRHVEKSIAQTAL
jgi:protoporphyrinogen/coproporphyrinogen III oxidase